MSRVRSCVSQVKPSPIGLNSIRSGKRSKTAFSPVAIAPFTNCTTPTFIPCPIARTAIPSAADVLPLPGPVWTMTSPFSTVFVAIFFACAACIFFIFAVCSASVRVFMGSPQHAGNEGGACRCAHATGRCRQRKWRDGLRPRHRGGSGRLVVARRKSPCRGLSLGLGSERPTPAGLLARGSGLDARLPRSPQWLSGQNPDGASCSPLTVAGTAPASERCALLTAFPIKPSRAPARSCAGHAPHASAIAQPRFLAMAIAARRPSPRRPPSHRSARPVRIARRTHRARRSASRSGSRRSRPSDAPWRDARPIC